MLQMGVNNFIFFPNKLVLDLGEKWSGGILNGEKNDETVLNQFQG